MSAKRRCAEWTAVPSSWPAGPQQHDVAAAETRRLALEIGNLRRQLASLPVIEQAKGILIGRFGIGPDAAFDVLRRWSSHSNCKIRDISQSLVAAASTTGGSTAPARTAALADLIDHLNRTTE